MVARDHAAWQEDAVTGVLLMEIKVAFPSITRGRLFHAMDANKIHGDRIRWTEGFLPEMTVVMGIEGNISESHPVEARVQQGAPILSIRFVIETACITGGDRRR